METVLLVNNNQVFTVSDMIESDNGEKFLIKGISFNSTPTNEKIVALNVEVL